MIISRYIQTSLLSIGLSSLSLVYAMQPARAVEEVKTEPQLTQIAKDFQDSCIHATKLSLSYAFERTHPQKQERAKLSALRQEMGFAHDLCIESINNLETGIIHLNRRLGKSTTRLENIYNHIDHLFSLARLSYTPVLYFYIYVLMLDISAYAQTNAFLCPHKDSPVHAMLIGKVDFIGRYDAVLSNILTKYLTLYEYYKQEQLDIYNHNPSLKNSHNTFFVKSWNYILYALKHMFLKISSIEQFIHNAPLHTIAKMKDELTKLFEPSHVQTYAQNYQAQILHVCDIMIKNTDQEIAKQHEQLLCNSSKSNLDSNILMRFIYAAYAKIKHQITKAYTIAPRIKQYESYRTALLENKKLIIALCN